MGKWITPQELYEAVAREWEEHYQRDPEHAWFRITVPWEQAGLATQEVFIESAMKANKQLHESLLPLSSRTGERKSQREERM